MITSKLFRRGTPFLRNVRLCIRDYSQSTQQAPIIFDIKTKLPNLEEKKPQRAPFVKNTFLGNFDTEFLAYPEPQEDDRHKEFFSWLQPIEEYVQTIDYKEIEHTGTIPDQVFDKLKELGVFRGKIPSDYGGLDLTNTEILKLIETLSIIPSLGIFFSNLLTTPVDLLLKYGSVEQKSHYLPKMATGDIIASVCITETESGSRADIKTSAFKTRCNKFLIVNGTKILVSNASYANLFLVFACVGESELSLKKDKLSLLLIDRDTPGVSVSPPTAMLGLRGFHSCTVSLKDVTIPLENIVGTAGAGSHFLPETLSSGKHNIGGQVVGILKRWHSLLTTCMLERTHFGKMMFECDSTKEIVSKLVCSIYAMESMMYLTTSMMDIFDKQDTLAEEAMVEVFCVSEGTERIDEGMSLIGTYSSLKGLPFEQIVRDMHTLRNYSTSIIDTKIFIGLLGLQHAGKHLAEKVRKVRNPLMHPKFNFLLGFTEKDQLKLDLQYELHPSLQDCAGYLERALYSLKKSVEYILMREGADVQNRHMEIRRIGEIATNIYALISVISRSSRAYCIGLRNAEQEIKAARMHSYVLYSKVKSLADDLELGDFGNGDCLHKSLADFNFESKKYFFEHPLTRNW